MNGALTSGDFWFGVAQVAGPILLVAAVLSMCGGCSGPIKCTRAQIVISAHPLKPRPAGVVAVGCDGRVLVEIEAGEVGL